jgi:hypothetical protein
MLFSPPPPLKLVSPSLVMRLLLMLPSSCFAGGAAAFVVPQLTLPLTPGGDVHAFLESVELRQVERPFLRLCGSFERDRVLQQVDEELKSVRRLGVTGVPFFVFKSGGVSGAQVLPLGHAIAFCCAIDCWWLIHAPSPYLLCCSASSRMRSRSL